MPDWNTVIDTASLYVELAYRKSENAAGGFTLNESSRPATIRDIALAAWTRRNNTMVNPEEAMEFVSHIPDDRRILFRPK